MKTLVWDWPIRIFHFAFATCTTLALLLAFTVDDDSPLFQVHMLLGLSAGFLLLVRIVAGILGGRHSRLRELFFPVRETLLYVIQAPLGRAKRYTGHNPGTAAIALGMFVLAAGLVFTGLGQGTEAAEELHELLAFGMLAAIAVHFAGVLLHTLRHKENIGISMLNGKKVAPPDAAIASARPRSGLLILALLALWGTLLFRGWNPGSGTLTLPGLATLRLGESEEESEEEGEEAEQEEEQEHAHEPQHVHHGEKHGRD